MLRDTATDLLLPLTLISAHKKGQGEDIADSQSKLPVCLPDPLHTMGIA